MSQTKRKTYSKEFKVNAVKMVLQHGRKASEVARDLSINEKYVASLETEVFRGWAGIVSGQR